MNKIAHYLQEHLLGEVTASPDLRAQLAHDKSVLEQSPAVAVYPRDETDIRKTVRFAWQLAERGKPIAVATRGFGQGTTGGSLSDGISLVLPKHMDQIEDFNLKKRYVTLQPGINYDSLNRVLRSHGLFFPVYPSDPHHTSLGSGLATNVAGEKSIKYGVNGSYVQNLRVVLSNGEAIDVGPLNKKELSGKLGLQTFEGSIYRALDTLLEENAEFIRRGREKIKVFYNSSGYNLFDVRQNEHFDLTPLILGSEGSLGIISQATLLLVEAPRTTSSVLVSLDDLNDLYEVMPRLLQLRPSSADFITRAAINEVLAINPNQLNDALSHPQAAIHLFIEFDDAKDKDRTGAVKDLQNTVDKVGGWSEGVSTENHHKLMKLKDSVATILGFSQGKQRAVPVAEDISVPVDRLVEFLHKVEKVYREVSLPPIAWGHAGIGVVRSQPLLDIGNTGDRQKLFKIQGSLYSAAIELGGSISATSGDGKVRAPYIPMMYGQELCELMLKVKKIFDPQNILNPGVKTAHPDEVKKLMRRSYTVTH